MLGSLYASANEALELLWGATAPGVEVMYGEPVHPRRLPPECLRILWLEHGGATNQSNKAQATLQLDIFVPGDNVPLALERAGEMDRRMGFTSRAGFGRFNVIDASGDPVLLVGHARVYPDPNGWLQVPDPVPELVHLARTIDVFAVARESAIIQPRDSYLLLEDGGHLIL